MRWSHRPEGLFVSGKDRMNGNGNNGNGQGLATRAALLEHVASALARLPRETHQIADLNLTVAVRGLTAKERDQVLRAARVLKGPRKGELDGPRFQTEVLTRCVLGA